MRVAGSLFYGDWHFISSRSFWPRRGLVPESLRLKVFNQADDPQEANALARFFPDAYLRYRFTSGLDELQSVSEEVSAILDAEERIESRYTLEVSSPGLDRPLKGEADYRRFLGKLAKLSSYEPVEGRRHWAGRLLSVEDGAVNLALEKEGGAVARVPLEKIAHGRLEVEFK